MSEEPRQPHTEASEEARELAARVERNLDAGSLDGAKRAFTQNWREVVPELPLRFSVILVRLNRSNVADVLKLRKKATKEGGSGPQLKLDFDEEGRVKVRMARGRKLRLGDLPHADAELLEQLGKKARRLYRPELLEVRRDKETHEINYVAVELVRAENKKPEEHAGNVAFHEVVERIASEASDADAEHPLDEK